METSCSIAGYRSSQDFLLDLKMRRDGEEVAAGYGVASRCKPLIKCVSRSVSTGLER
jgi:hypothetical protein